MNPYLLLILLSSWSLLVTHSKQCETGVAFPGHVLSIQRSLMANADVAFLKAYDVKSLEQCMEDCCSGTYGSCSVASFKRNATQNNCLHFNCRPLNKCKFLSSNSTDSFSFSAYPISSSSVPSKPTTDKGTSPAPTTAASKLRTQSELSTAKEDIATFAVEQFAIKNDNTTIKPRKGVYELTPLDINSAKSGVKPRKGVSMEDVPLSKYLLNSINKSKVKPRKGVGPYSTTSDISPTTTVASAKYHSETYTTLQNHTNDTPSYDLISALEKVFEDDPLAKNTKSSPSSAIASTASSTFEITPTLFSSSIQLTNIINRFPTSSRIEITSSYGLKSSIEETMSSFGPSSLITPSLLSSAEVIPNTIEEYTFIMPSAGLPDMATHSILSQAVTQATPTIFIGQESDKSKSSLLAVEHNKESENDKRYKSSMHLVLSLVFGLLVLFAVLGVVAKRVYDGWLRRDYYRMNYLIDGIYNGY